MRALLFALAALLIAGAADAQTRPPAPVSGFNPTTSAVSEEQLLGALKPVTGSITIPDGKAAVLIQPDGQAYRDYHRGVLPWLIGIFVIGTTVALVLFYLTRGRIPIEGGPSGRTLTRFGGFERFMHWLVAVSWIVLAISGLNVAIGAKVLMPLIGADAFAAFAQIAKYSHNYMAFPFTLGIVLMLLVWIRHNIPNKIDLEWFRQGGGLIGKGHPPSGRFNGGQKMIFWIVVGFGGLIAATGFVLMFPFTVTDIGGMQVMQVIHGALSVVMIAAILGHIYIGSVGMEGAFDAMGNGRVDVNWAKAHHDKWAAQELAKQRGAAE